ncbi:MAG TPA: hypothetical protein VGQ81_15835, partial [Acidobacteriota bacterium]|nr:hypothetical protein [Acidobacteriota bacterium]
TEKSFATAADATQTESILYAVTEELIPVSPDYSQKIKPRGTLGTRGPEATASCSMMLLIEEPYLPVSPVFPVVQSFSTEQSLRDDSRLAILRGKKFVNNPG